MPPRRRNVKMPMHLDYPDVKDHDQDRIDLTFCLQRHICVHGLCLKTFNGNQECRFKFPKAKCSQTCVRVIREHRHDGSFGQCRLELLSKRDKDVRIVNHNIEQLEHWRANCDFSVLFDLKKVLAYVSKYATKAESRSNVFKAAFNSVFARSLDEIDTRHALRQVMTKVLAERDVSVHEALHLLLSKLKFKKKY